MAPRIPKPEHVGDAGTNGAMAAALSAAGVESEVPATAEPAPAEG
jgi:hypothetical protein